MSGTRPSTRHPGGSAQRVVLTGGAGFIGSHLAERLIELGYHVTVLDELSTGRKENISHLLGDPSFAFVQGSILDRDLLGGLSQGATYVFHQAAIPSVPRSMQDPLATHHANATGTLNVLLAARDARVAHVVLASSCAVYGDPSAAPLTEDTLPQPLSPYAVSKLAAEAFCAVFTRAYGLPTTALRYFNVYGPRQDPNSEYAAVIPKFIRAALAGQHLTIYGSGNQTRDFTYVTDVVAANILAATHGLTGVYNVGCGDVISVRQLADLILRLTGSNSQVVLADARPGDILASQADVSRLMQYGWTPSTSLAEGLQKAITATQQCRADSDVRDAERGATPCNTTPPHRHQVTR